MERKLLTIRKIRDIKSIKGADFIELAFVDGWQVIVKKGNFKVGDYGYYFEIDSLLPEIKEFNFLNHPVNSLNGKGYRIKTIRMKGVMSQGLLLPLDIFNSYLNEEYQKILYQDYSDEKEREKAFNLVIKYLMCKLNIKLYESLYNKSEFNTPKEDDLNKFPNFLHKTNLERIQNKMDYFEKYKYYEFEISEKLNGTSFTCWNIVKSDEVLNDKSNILIKFIKKIYYKLIDKDNVFGVASKNINLSNIKNKDNNLYWEIVRKYNLDMLLKNTNYAIQGEIIGPKIQKNYEKVDENKLYIFNIYDIKNKKDLNSEEREMFIQKLQSQASLCYINNGVHGKIVESVPITYKKIEILQWCRNIDDFQKFIEKEYKDRYVPIEGIVCKDINNPRISFKYINNNIL